MAQAQTVTATDPVEVIFPAQLIHMVAGPTGAGKTRWLLDTMVAWQAGRPVLGFRSSPRPWLYVCGDRQEHEIKRTIASLGHNSANIPTFAAFGVMPPIGALGVLDEAEKCKAEVLVWEGFSQYVESNAGNSGVKRWLNMIAWRLAHYVDGRPRFAPLTIIAVMEQPKMSEKNKYANKRQRISGPAAWGHTAATIINIEHADKNCTTSDRILDVFPHHDHGAMHFNATLEDGHFRVVDP